MPTGKLIRREGICWFAGKTKEGNKNVQTDHLRSSSWERKSDWFNFPEANPALIDLLFETEGKQSVWLWVRRDCGCWGRGRTLEDNRVQCVKWRGVTLVTCRSQRQRSPNWAQWLVLHCGWEALRTDSWFIFDSVVSNASVFRKNSLSLNTDQTTREHMLQQGSYSLLTNNKEQPTRVQTTLRTAGSWFSEMRCYAHRTTELQGQGCS